MNVRAIRQAPREPRPWPCDGDAIQDGDVGVVIEDRGFGGRLLVVEWPTHGGLITHEWHGVTVEDAPAGSGLFHEIVAQTSRLS